jgi:hypothetical protein
MVNARNEGVGHLPGASPSARCIAADAPIDKLAWDTGLKGIPKITAAQLGNGDDVIVGNCRIPVRELVYILD